VTHSAPNVNYEEIGVTRKDYCTLDSNDPNVESTVAREFLLRNVAMASPSLRWRQHLAQRYALE